MIISLWHHTFIYNVVCFVLLRSIRSPFYTHLRDVYWWRTHHCWWRWSTFESLNNINFPVILGIYVLIFMSHVSKDGLFVTLIFSFNSRHILLVHCFDIGQFEKRRHKKQKQPSKKTDFSVWMNSDERCWRKKPRWWCKQSHNVLFQKCWRKK